MVLRDKFTSSMSSTAVDKIVLTDCILTGVNTLFFHVDITMLIDMASSRVEEQDHSEQCRAGLEPRRAAAVPSRSRAAACRWSCCPAHLVGVEAEPACCSCWVGAGALCSPGRCSAPAGWKPACSAPLASTAGWGRKEGAGRRR